MGSATFRIAQAFQKTYLQKRYQLDENIDIIQGDLLETSARFRYYQVGGKEILQLIFDEIEKLNVDPNDLVILAPTHETVRSIEYDFRHKARELTTHAGETQEEYKRLLEIYPQQGSRFRTELETIRRGRKLHFWGHAGTAKFSTIYFFKG